jgi:hypothetical protein
MDYFLYTAKNDRNADKPIERLVVVELLIVVF